MSHNGIGKLGDELFYRKSDFSNFKGNCLMRFLGYLDKQLAQLWVWPAGAPVSLLKALQQKICFLSHRRWERKHSKILEN
jgi:hypothetical protein